MCGFKVGDEVTPIDKEPWFNACRGYHNYGPAFGEVVTIARVVREGNGTWLGFDQWGDVELFAASDFRKVQRRDLTEWLSQSVSNTDKLDRPLPALPEKEGV